MINKNITTGYHIPYNPKLKKRARELRNNMTVAESKIWKEFLKSFPCTVLRQKPIDNYIVDFYCASLKLVIEIDGESHEDKDAIEYDRERTAILEGYGLKVIRFTNDEVVSSFDDVCEYVMSFVQT